MKIPTVLFLSALILFGCAKDDPGETSTFACKAEITSQNEDFGRNAELDAYLQSRVSSGIPGIQLAVRNETGSLWSSADGSADLASSLPLQDCHQTRVGSTVKTFTAVSILLLREQGLLELDDPVSAYLSPSLLEDLENADETTIRQLLQHSSGIYNYISSAQFQTASLNDLTKTWQPDELLAYAEGRSAAFDIGADVAYSNTNYVLLGMLIEEVTGEPFHHFFEEHIFEPLGMGFTQFAATDPVPDGIVRGYVDLYSNLNVIDATDYSGWDYFTADGGLISNPHDLTLFLSALFQGEILSAESLDEMLVFRAPSEVDDEFYPITFGLGIFEIETPYGRAYIHSGDAIGYFASMAYFPEQGTAISWTANGNYGKLDDFTQSRRAMDELFGAVLG